MSYGLSTENISLIRQVLGHYPEIEKATIYGSRAMGCQRENSDIDLCLEGENLSARTLSRLETELDDLLLPYMFDLSIMDQIDHPDLLAHIQRAGSVFYEPETKTLP